MTSNARNSKWMQRSLILFAALALVSPARAWAQGEPLGPEFRVNTYTPDAQSLAFVASDSTGDFVVTWSSRYQDGSSWGVFGQRYASSGAPLGPEFRVNTYTTDLQIGSGVAADPSGNFVVVWNSVGQDGSDYGVFGQRYASSGAPLGSEFRVNTHTTERQGNSEVASDTGGNFVVVWNSTEQDGSGDGVFGQRYASSGTPVGPEFPVNTFTTGAQVLPNVSSDPSGNFVVVWTGAGLQDGSGNGIFGQRFASSGAPVGPEFRVNTYTTGNQANFRHSVASDASGNFVVVWYGAFQDGSAYGVFGQRYASSGSPLGPEFRVNTYTTGEQRIPTVAADPSGNFVVTWVSYAQDGSDLGIFGQRYSSSGEPLGSEFRVNTQTMHGQTNTVVTSDATGNFVVVWRSAQQDGSDNGVFAQRYGQIVPVELMRFGVE
jgi:hypothetical protein